MVIAWESSSWKVPCVRVVMERVKSRATNEAFSFPFPSLIAYHACRHTHTESFLIVCLFCGDFSVSFHATNLHLSTFDSFEKPPIQFSGGLILFRLKPLHFSFLFASKTLWFSFFFSGTELGFFNELFFFLSSLAFFFLSLSENGKDNCHATEPRADGRAIINCSGCFLLLGLF